MIMINKQTVFLKSPKRSLVKPRSSGSCVCDDWLPIFSFSFFVTLSSLSYYSIWLILYAQNRLRLVRVSACPIARCIWRLWMTFWAHCPANSSIVLSQIIIVFLRCLRYQSNPANHLWIRDSWSACVRWCWLCRTRKMGALANTTKLILSPLPPQYQ